jgi:hypothetical protein
MENKEKKIHKNFLVISNYLNDLSWVTEYTENYVIYDKTDSARNNKNIDPSKIIKSSLAGYNSYDYFSFIIENYEKLPDCTIFAKGHCFPRHVSKEYFDRVMNNEFFTPLEDYKMHKTYSRDGELICFFSPEGGFCEINNSWYLSIHPTKYFQGYNDFLKFCFMDPVIPLYTRFAPGGDYIVPKQNILKLPKIFYENLRVFIGHHQLSGETHIIERAMHTLWTCNFEINPNMLKPIDGAFTLKPKGEILSKKMPFRSRVVARLIRMLKKL